MEAREGLMPASVLRCVNLMYVSGVTAGINRGYLLDNRLVSTRAEDMAGKLSDDPRPSLEVKHWSRKSEAEKGVPGSVRVDEVVLGV